MGFGASLPSCHENRCLPANRLFTARAIGYSLSSSRPRGSDCAGRTGMTILPAGSANRHWLSTGLALVLSMGLAATCQAGMVVKTDPPARQASPASAPAALATPVAPATQKTPAKAAAPAPSSPPAPATQRPSTARASGKTAPPAAARPLARSGGQTGQADRAGWPACIRQLNAMALFDHWDTERRQALLEQCP